MEERTDIGDNDSSILAAGEEPMRHRPPVGDFAATLLNPLSCLPQCSRPTRIVWDMEEGEIHADPSCTNKTPDKRRFRALHKSSLDSCANLTLDSIESTAATTPEPLEYLPVDLLAEPAHILDECPRILSIDMIRQLHEDGLTGSHQMCRWERCFAIGRDGDSFVTFMERCAPYQRTLVVIQTVEGYILGGYAAMPWGKRDQFSNSYYGTGQSFLFGSHPAGVSKDEDTAKPLHLFRWTGKNDFCQICDKETSKVGMGGGMDFGFLVQDHFWRGRSGPCGTFGNPSLVPHSEYFEIEALECYGLRSFAESSSSELPSWTITDA